jgi:hypothetical protein
LNASALPVRPWAVNLTGSYVPRPLIALGNAGKQVRQHASQVAAQGMS